MKIRMDFWDIVGRLWYATVERFADFVGDVIAARYTRAGDDFFGSKHDAIAD